MMFYSSSTIEADHLAALALDAATELDKLQRKGKVNIKAITSFADAIAHFSGIDGETNAEANWLDPASSEMFSAAVAQSTAKRISDIDALNEELSELVGKLRQGPDKFDVDAAKTFCLSIHDFILRSRANSGLHEKGVFDYDYSYSG